MSQQYGELRPTSGRTIAAEILYVGEFMAPQQISTGCATWLRYCSDVVHRRPTTLCTMFERLLGLYTIYTFSEALPLDGISLRAKFTLRPRLAFSYIDSVTARHSSSGVSLTWRRGTRNGITELSQMAPPIFGWAAITLGIGPHSSSFMFRPVNNGIGP